MGWIESRLQAAEGLVQMIYRRLLALEATVTGIRQQLRGAYQQIPGGGGGGGSTTLYYCVPSANVPLASANPAAGVQGSLTGQTVYSYTVSGGYFTVSTSATVLNPSPNNPLVSGVLTFLAPNSDGTYSSSGQIC